MKSVSLSTWLVCLTYFSIVVKRHHNQGNLYMKVYWGLDGEHSSRQLSMTLEQQLRTHILIHKLEVKSTNWKWCGLLKPQRMTPVTRLLQQSHIFPNSSTVEQAFKYKLMETIVFQTTTGLNNKNNNLHINMPLLLSYPSLMQ